MVRHAIELDTCLHAGNTDAHIPSTALIRPLHTCPTRKHKNREGFAVNHLGEKGKLTQIREEEEG